VIQYDREALARIDSGCRGCRLPISGYCRLAASPPPVDTGGFFLDSFQSAEAAIVRSISDDPWSTRDMVANS
jgi:hypothetical protein